MISTKFKFIDNFQSVNFSETTLDKSDTHNQLDVSDTPINNCIAYSNNNYTQNGVKYTFTSNPTKDVYYSNLGYDCSNCYKLPFNSILPHPNQETAGHEGIANDSYSGNSYIFYRGGNANGGNYFLGCKTADATPTDINCCAGSDINLKYNNNSSQFECIYNSFNNNFSYISYKNICEFDTNSNSASYVSVDNCYANKFSYNTDKVGLFPSQNNDCVAYFYNYILPSYYINLAFFPSKSDSTSITNCNLDQGSVTYSYPNAGSLTVDTFINNSNINAAYLGWVGKSEMGNCRFTDFTDNNYLLAQVGCKPFDIRFIPVYDSINTTNNNISFYIMVYYDKDKKIDTTTSYYYTISTMYQPVIKQKKDIIRNSFVYSQFQKVEDKFTNYVNGYTRLYLLNHTNQMAPDMFRFFTKVVFKLESTPSRWLHGITTPVVTAGIGYRNYDVSTMPGVSFTMVNSNSVSPVCSGIWSCCYAFHTSDTTGKWPFLTGPQAGGYGALCTLGVIPTLQYLLTDKDPSSWTADGKNWTTYINYNKIGDVPTTTTFLEALDPDIKNINPKWYISNINRIKNTSQCTLKIKPTHLPIYKSVGSNLKIISSVNSYNFALSGDIETAYYEYFLNNKDVDWFANGTGNDGTYNCIDYYRNDAPGGKVLAQANFINKVKAFNQDLNVNARDVIKYFKNPTGTTPTINNITTDQYTVFTHMSSWYSLGPKITS